MIRKITIATALCFIFSTQFVSAQEADLTKGCIKTSDLTVIAQKFRQFNRYVDSNKEEVCSEELGSDNYQMLSSLMVLKDSSPKESILDVDDAYTYEAITEKNWWAYFTNRANKLTVDNNCRENVVAYVYGFSKNGNVYLCRPYFESNRSSQASTLMHEARHFDGHGHVRCTRGNEDGNQGACDNLVTLRGSYAISLQTLVGLARSEKTERPERLMLEAEAIYMAYNKFNTVPKLKMSNYLYLSNDEGEVYRWNSQSEDDLVLAAKLNEPSVILNSYNRFTIYPLNTESKAYRLGRDLESRVSNPGLYAVHFNSLSPDQRSEYDSVVYFGDGGLLVNNKLQTFCDGKLATRDLNSINQFTRIISLPEGRDGFDQDAFLLASSGDLYSLECESRKSSKVNIKKTNLKIDPSIANNIVESFSIDSEQFAMLSDGRVIGLTLEGRTYKENLISLPFAESNWVGATMLRLPEIFE